MSASRERLFTWGAVVASVLLVGSLAVADSARGPSGLAAWTAPPRVSGTVPSQAASPAAAPSTGRSATPAPVDWARLTLPATPTVADLVPTDADASGVALDTTFRLTTRTNETAASLAGRLTASPDVSLAVVAGSDGGPAASVLVRPAQPLAAGRVYRFSLTSPGGAVEQSWAFQAKAPLHVVTTVPGNHTADVPLDTGIEFTFDQDGVSSIDGFLDAEPAIPGTLEYHGRTAVLVPSQPLARRTVYTVTLRHGVPQQGSDQVLGDDVVVQFQTGTGTAEQAAPGFALARRVYESAPGERPVLETQWYARTDGASPPLVPLTVYRFPSMQACLDAYRRVEDAPQWVSWPTAEGLVAVDGLAKVGSFSVRLTSEADSYGSWLRLPVELDAGWYLVATTAGDVPYQAFLQVTDIASFASVTETKTAVWVNDVGTGAAVSGATVTTSAGERLGATDARGLVIDTTPASLVPPVESEPLPGGTWPIPVPLRPLVVRAPDGRAAFVPLASGCGWYGFCSASRWVNPGDRWWEAMGTDRSSYRDADTIHVWGLVRERGQSAPGAAPASIELRLVLDERWPYIGGGGADIPPAMTTRVATDADGNFSGDLAFTGLDHGTYRVEARVGDELVATRYVSVGIIVKPSYALSIATDRHAYIAGEPVVTTITAAYYDGTPVPGVEVQVDGFGTPTTVTTGIDGTAELRLPAGPVEYGQWQPVWLSARVARAEEGDIAAQSTIVVFGADRLLDGTGRIEDGRLHLAGSLATLDRAAVDSGFDPADPWPSDPRGDPIGAATVTARLVELVPVRTEIGRHYDFIEKRTVVDYRYDITRVTERSFSLRTDRTGAFVLDAAVAHPAHDYEIELSTVDPRGRTGTLVVAAASGATPAEYWARWAYLEPLEGQSGTVRSAYLPGSTISLVMRDGGGALPDGGGNRYLFLGEQRGLRDARVQASSRLDRTFGSADVPSLAIVGVRFTGTTYQVASGYTAVVDTSAYALTVEITPDAAAHEPGDAAAVDVTTTDASGRPVSATVVVRAVDQKLHDSGAAYDEDPLQQLYAQTSGGEIATYASHQYPFGAGDGRGNATGGGGGAATPAPAAEAGSTAGRTRTDFRDTLFLERVRTGADGRAHVEFRMSDDLTGWRVTATAFASGLRAGQAAISMPVGLPFFVGVQLAPEYVTSDAPSVRLRAYGTSLRTGDEVTFTVSSAELGMAPTTATGAAFTAVDVPLPALRAGTVSLTIEGRVERPGGGAGPATDRLVRTFTVVDARQVQLGTWSGSLADPLPSMGTGLATLVFEDRGTGSLLAMLQSLAWGGHARADGALAATLAQRLLAAHVPSGDGEPAAFDAARYQEGGTGGVSLLPYTSPDLELSALVALTAPDDVNRASLAAYLGTVRSDDQSTTERRNIALAGLAGLGEPVLATIQDALAGTGLTPRERLFLAAGALAQGDAAAALSAERAVLEAYGETLGPWIRVRLGGPTDSDAEATALVAWLAAGAGDAVADGALRYVVENPPDDLLLSLQEVEAIGRLLEAARGEASSFSYTVDGVEHPVTLAPGGAFSIVLSAAQRATLRLIPKTGTVGVTASWRAPLATTGGTAGLTIARTVDPVGTIDGSRLVEVTLSVALPSKTPRGCYEISEAAPSGLMPVSRGLLPPGSIPEEDVVDPYAIDGQLVSFCVAPDGPARARYFARVVTPGTYAWEPAVIDSGVRELGSAQSAAGTVVIR